MQKEKWKYWNTFLHDAEPQQPFQEGQETLLAMRRLPKEAKTEFQARITLLQPEVCLRWNARIPGLAIEQVFELQSLGRDRTQYVHQAHFSGILARVVLPFIRRDEQQGMRRMAWELRQYVEQTIKERESIAEF